MRSLGGSSFYILPGGLFAFFIAIWASRSINLWALLTFGGEPGITTLSFAALIGGWILLLGLFIREYSSTRN